MIDLSEVAHWYPERLDGLERVVSIVELIVGRESVGECRVEFTDRLRGQAFGVYSERLIELCSYQPEMAEITLVHELGHFISDDTDWLQTEYAFMKWVGAVVGDDWAQAIRNSDAGKRHKSAEYLGDWREFWARSFTQWIANRSGDCLLLVQLAEIQEDHWESSDFLAIGESLDSWRRIDENVGRSS